MSSCKGMGALGSNAVGEMGLMMTKLDILQKRNCYGRTHVSGNNSSAESVSKACRLSYFGKNCEELHQRIVCSRT